MNPLPPQAYTKETLVKAYQWMQHQSDSIKEMATNPDMLVGLFLKAKLQGDGALERPSIQNFKSELRNLAGMMGEFEVVETPTPNTPPTSNYAGASAMMSPPQQHAPPAQTYTPPMPTAPPAQTQAASMMSPPPPPPQASSPALLAANSVQSAPFKGKQAPELDTRSWLMIQEVKNQLNVSTEQEALRILISVGHSKIKGLLDK